MADFCGFYRVRMLRSSALVIDNGSRKRDALAALRALAASLISLARAHRAGARGLTHVPLPYRIAHAHNHEAPSG
jgi:hypothetical protein